MSPRTLENFPDHVEWSFPTHGTRKVNRELLALAMEVIARWSQIDLLILDLVSRFVPATDPRLVADMILAIDSRRPREAALEAAAKRALSPHDFENFFKGVMKKVDDKRDRRNTYAHALFGYSDDLPDALLLIDPRERARGFADWTRFIRESFDSGKHPGDILENPDSHEVAPDFPKELDRSSIEVIERDDLERELEVAGRIWQMVVMLSAMLSPLDPSDEARRQLSIELGTEPNPPDPT